VIGGSQDHQIGHGPALSLDDGAVQGHPNLEGLADLTS
jgi:hypothetical protein